MVGTARTAEKKPPRMAEKRIKEVESHKPITQEKAEPRSSEVMAEESSGRWSLSGSCSFAQLASVICYRVLHGSLGCGGTVSQASLKPLETLPQLPKCWDERCELCQARFPISFFFSRVC